MPSRPFLLRAGTLLRVVIPLVVLPSTVITQACAQGAQEGAPPLFTGPSVDLSHGPLRVSDDGRRLVHADGTPFFWLGDTAWHLFHRLDREEAEVYLEDRRSKGFNVIQAVVLAEHGGLTVPNPYGDLPLHDNDPTRPVEAYFEHVDFIVQRAAEKGMFIGMLPTWGDKFNQRWGEGPEIFTPENARVYGEFLARRYSGKPIIWILGGDRNPETEEHLAIIRAMAAGIEAGWDGDPVITYHPMGSSASSTWFHEDEWLDLNLFQSGHSARDIANYSMTLHDLALQPAKPVVDGEPRYEDHPVDWNPEKGWFDDFDVRQAAYWSVLSGAAGHTYGNHDIWQMWEPGREPISSARTPWREALEHPGSRQMGILRRLMESGPFLQLIPDTTSLRSGRGEGAGHQVAARARDGSILYAYTPLGEQIAVATDWAPTARLRASWFDPRTGARTAIGTVPRGGEHRFDPPGEVGRGNDWVLLLEAEAGAPRGA
ncbi:MAG TPA: glycoside hydrolase family 140 protein [Longimicrobiaceae bacterium]